MKTRARERVSRQRLPCNHTGENPPPPQARNRLLVFCTKALISFKNTSVPASPNLSAPFFFFSNMIAVYVFLPLSFHRATTHSCPHSSLRKNSVRNIIKGQARHLFLNPLAPSEQSWAKGGLLLKCLCVKDRDSESDVFVFTGTRAHAFSLFLWAYKSIWDASTINPQPKRYRFI